MSNEKRLRKVTNQVRTNTVFYVGVKNRSAFKKIEAVQALFIIFNFSEILSINYLNVT